MANTQASDGKISVYGLGHSGVIIDVNPLDPGFPEDSLRSAQNATHELTAEHLGALRKRPGLIQFNQISAGGSILGGIPMAIAGTGGAPSTATGNDGGLFGSAGGGDPSQDSGTGTGIGAGDGSGAPGGTSSGGPATFGGGGAGGFNSGTILFNGKRLVMIGFIDNTDTNAGGEGWFVTSQGVNDSASIVTGTGFPGVVYSFPPTSVCAAHVGQPCAFYGPNGYFYYQAAHRQLGVGAQTTFSGTGTTTTGTVNSSTGLATGQIWDILQSGIHTLVTCTQVNGTAVAWQPALPSAIAGGETLNLAETRPAIYRSNGLAPTSVATIPRVTGTDDTGANGGARASTTNLDQRSAILFMHWGYDGNIYVCVKDRADGQDVNSSLNYGRVFRLDPNSGALTDINTIGGLSGGLGLKNIIPYTCALFDNKLYIGEFNLASSELQSSVQNAIVDIVASDYKSFKPYGLSIVSGGGGGISCSLPFPSRVPPSQAWTDTQVIANRVLFVGTTRKKAASPGTADLWYYNRDAANVGTIVTSVNPGLGDQGTGVDGNGWISLVDFNGNLYASYFNKAVASNIYKYTPTYTNKAADGYWDGSGTWSNVLTGTNTFAYYLFVDNVTPGVTSGYIYAIGLQSESAGTPKVYSSPDGTNWTDQSANLPAGVHSRISLPILFGANQ